MTYRERLNTAMRVLALDSRVVFVGQAVAYPGTAMYETLDGVPPDRRIEMPVAEDMQMGLCVGMSLRGAIPVCIFPRINFMLLAINQLVNHLDKIPIYGNGWRPKVIVRTAIAHHEPMNPGPQHLGDYRAAIELMLAQTPCVTLRDSRQIVPAYEAALERARSTVLFEMAECYDDR